MTSAQRSDAPQSKKKGVGEQQSSKYDDYNRETKQRHVGTHRSTSNSSGGSGNASEAPAGADEQAFLSLESGGGGAGRASLSPSSSSRSSSISSEAESFSSDDSDVETVRAYSSALHHRHITKLCFIPSSITDRCASFL